MLFRSPWKEVRQGKNYPMCGVLKGYGYRKGKNGRFGYISVSPFEDMPLLKQGEAIRGHEFHYWDSTGFKDACVMEYESWRKKTLREN